MCNFDVTFIKPGCSTPQLTFLDVYFISLVVIALSSVMFTAASVVRALLAVRSSPRHKRQSSLTTPMRESGVELAAISGSATARKERALSLHPAAAGASGWWHFRARVTHSHLILGSIMYLRLTTLELQALNCTTVVQRDGSILQVLKVDLSTVCYQGAHQQAMFVVWPVLLLYCVGFPLLCCVLLYRSFHSVAKAAVQQSRQSKLLHHSSSNASLSYRPPRSHHKLNSSVSRMSELEMTRTTHSRSVLVSPPSVVSPTGAHVRSASPSLRLPMMWGSPTSLVRGLTPPSRGGSSPSPRSVVPLSPALARSPFSSAAVVREAEEKKSVVVQRSGRPQRVEERGEGRADSEPSTVRARRLTRPLRSQPEEGARAVAVEDAAAAETEDAVHDPRSLNSDAGASHRRSGSTQPSPVSQLEDEEADEEEEAEVQPLQSVDEAVAEHLAPADVKAALAELAKDSGRQELLGYMYRQLRGELYYFRIIAFATSFGFACSAVLPDDPILRLLLTGLLFLTDLFAVCSLLPFEVWWKNAVSALTSLVGVVECIALLALVQLGLGSVQGGDLSLGHSKAAQQTSAAPDSALTGANDEAQRFELYLGVALVGDVVAIAVVHRRAVIASYQRHVLPRCRAVMEAVRGRCERRVPVVPATPSLRTQELHALRRVPVMRTSSSSVHTVYVHSPLESPTHVRSSSQERRGAD